VRRIITALVGAALLVMTLVSSVFAGGKVF
jgi:hypothetical protein